MNHHISRRTALASLAAASLCALAPLARAQVPADYPNRPVRLIVPFAPGGGTDVTARMFADKLRIELGQPVILDNRPGATGIIGTGAAMQAAPDGYTLLFTTSTNQVIAPLLLEKPPYDGAKDFTPISFLIRYLGVLLVSAPTPAKTVPELIAYAKQNPGKLNYASSGIGSTNHLLGEMLKNRAGIDMLHVPYKGSAPAVQALANNEVQVFFDTVPSAQNWVKQGKVRILATGSDRRSALLPDVPTLVELGVFDGSTDYWMGVMAPPGMSPALQMRLNQIVARTMASSEMAQFAQRNGGEIATGSPQVFATLLTAEQARWREVIRKNNIHAE